ncbi:hypothetical protein BDV27DRAFT_124719 [Aspergillus caelatus]|uniref:Uncharacterized protein n=1 Tax=Aspergillus caelatus TaxID=61420 RepID=A0A5N7AAL6_9EURO|nr:uncharacterized protein BDV27DRAFT_124719 [Aspergillus caelatus]KAE8366872.1 hypothetical protein BDV27DRAFT_124719 [Aspergillus caelatus]
MRWSRWLRRKSVEHRRLTAKTLSGTQAGILSRLQERHILTSEPQISDDVYDPWM